MKITKLWLNETSYSGGSSLDLLADFDNDRHHAVRVEPPHTAREVASALHILAVQIARDQHLEDMATNGDVLTWTPTPETRYHSPHGRYSAPRLQRRFLCTDADGHYGYLWADVSPEAPFTRLDEIKGIQPGA